MCNSLAVMHGWCHLKTGPFRREFNPSQTDSRILFSWRVILSSNRECLQGASIPSSPIIAN